MEAMRRLSETLLRLTKSRAIDSGILDEAFREVCVAAADALDLARVSVWSYDAEAGSIRCEELFERLTATHSSGLELSEVDFPRYFAAMKEERILAMENAHTDPVTAEFSAVYLTPLGINSMLDAPIRFDGRLWGVLCHEHVGEPRTWPLGAQTFAASLADYVARALSAQRATRAQQELARLNANLEDAVAAEAFWLTCRTKELRQANEALTETLNRLQSTQAQLVESEKLAALGAVVAGIAHEVNTPLGVALTASSYGSEQLGKLEESLKAGSLKKSDLAAYLQSAREVADLVGSNLSRAAGLVRSFKQVAVRQTSDQVETFSLVDALESATLSMSPELRKSRVLVRVEGDRALTLTAAPGFVFPLVSNLVMNALLHAFPEGGSGQVTFRVGAEDADRVVLEYVDDGRGVDGETLRRLFEPFFTTRRGQGGSGLGLHIVWTLITEELGGTIQAAGSPGQGLRLTMILPRIGTTKTAESL